MAQKVSITLVDDIDGTSAAETLTFGLDGRQYEIDLNKKNAQKLRAALSGYVQVARATGKAKVQRTKTSSGPSAKEVRAWAQEQGIEVPAQGRVPKALVEQYVGQSKR